jgi:hypothetical protein
MIRQRLRAKIAAALNALVRIWAGAPSNGRPYRDSAAVQSQGGSVVLAGPGTTALPVLCFKAPVRSLRPRAQRIVAPLAHPLNLRPRPRRPRPLEDTVRRMPGFPLPVRFLPPSASGSPPSLIPAAVVLGASAPLPLRSPFTSGSPQPPIRAPRAPPSSVSPPLEGAVPYAPSRVAFLVGNRVQRPDQRFCRVEDWRGTP